MINLRNIKEHTVERPDSWTAFGTPADFDALPRSHKEQIQFMDWYAQKYIEGFLDCVKLVTGNNDDPFSGSNFKTVNKYYISDAPKGEQELKKWLFQRDIAFRTTVFILPRNGKPILTTWKIVIKYCYDLFYSCDMTIFDETLNWCLFYFHHNQLFFGKNNIYNPEGDYKRMEERIALKKLFPYFKFSH